MELGWDVLRHMDSSFQGQRLRQNIRVAGQRLGLLKGQRMERFVPQLLTVPCTFPSVLRDISERGRDLEQILSQYITFVKPAFEEFCLPVSRAVPPLGGLEQQHLVPRSASCALLPLCRLCWPGQGVMGTVYTATAFLVRSPFPSGRQHGQRNPSLCKG